MVDAGGPGSVRKCLGWLWLTLVTLKGSIEAERKTSFTLSSCLMGSTKEKNVPPSEGIRSLKFEELSDVDISHAVPRRLHNLAFTGDKWVAFADPVQQTGWLIDLKIASPYVVTGKEHKLQKVVNSGTWLCSFIPETRNIIVSKTPGPSYVLKTGNGKRGSFKMVSEFPQRESTVWGYLCRRYSSRSFLEMGLTTSLMSYPASSSSGHKNTQINWLVGCFGFNGPLRQYFSLYRAVSQREGEKKEKR